MPLVYNGITVTDLIYNGVALDKVIYNGVEVFTKAPSIIREPATGDYYTNNTNYSWSHIFTNVLSVYWGTVKVYSKTFVNDTARNVVTSFSSGGYTYYKGSLKYTTGANRSDYGIYRIKN